MAFTTSDDLNILQASDTNNVGAGAGNDTYIINSSSTASGQVINITDTEGANVIKLVGGVTITSSVAAANVVQLTLSNGAVINVLGADAFTFEIGGDAFTTGSGTSQTFTEFVTQSLGIAAVPTGSDTATGNANVTTNTDGTVTGGATTATFALTAGAASVDEGATATFNLATTNVADGTSVAFTLTGIDAADLASGSLTGTTTVTGGAATISVALADDTTTEGAETLTVSIDGQTATASTTVNDTSQTSSTFTLTSGTDSGADFTGTTSDDTYNAAVLTATAGDSLDGGAGSDTLNIETNSNLTSSFATANIETVNVTSLGAISVDTSSMTGITTLNSVDSTGTITVNNIAASSLEVGLQGSSTNTLDLNYATSVLTGSADKLGISLNGATSANITADTGFESAEVNTSAASTLSSLTAPTATALTLSGTSALTVDNSAIDSFTDYTITNTAAITLGSVATVSSLDATANTGGITPSSTNTNSNAGFTLGLSDAVLAMSAAGSTILLGSGADNVNVSSAAILTTGNGTVKLGEGNDQLNISGVGSGGLFVFGEDGDDTIHAAAGIGATSLVDGGLGTDTLSLAAATYSNILKGVENLNINGATTTTASFTTTDTALTVTDSGAAAVTVSNILNGSSYTSSTAKTGALALNFKSGEAATINVDLTKGTAQAIALTNVSNATVTTGAASTITGGISLDNVATALTINATGAFDNTNAGILASSSTESLKTITATGDQGVLLGLISNDNALTDLVITGGSGNATATNIATSATTVNQLTASSTSGLASLGAIDTTGSTGAVINTLTALTLSSTSGTGTTTVTSLDADKVGTISVTATAGVASTGAITIGADTTDKTDGTLTSLSVSALGNAAVGALKVDDVGSISVTSTNTSTAGTTTIGTIQDGNAAGNATVGTVTLSGMGAATVGAITADALGNVSVTSTASTIGLGAITVTNSGNDSVTGTITAAASGNITLGGAIALETSGAMSFDSSAAGIVLEDITANDSTGTTITLDAATTIAGASATKTITNDKGDLSVTVKGAGTFGVAQQVDFDAGSSTASDIDITVNALGLSGNFGASGNVSVITNAATDSASSVTFTGGVSDSFVSIVTVGGTIAYNGNIGVDTITLGSATAYTSATIFGEAGADVITGGLGADTINGGEGADVITGGLGADIINLTETTAAIDVVTIDGGLTKDTISQFTAGTGGDKLYFDVSVLDAAAKVTANDLDFVEIFDNNSVADAGGTEAAAGIQTLTTIGTATDANNFFLVDLGTTKFASAAAAVDVLETGGDAALSFVGNIAQHDAFLFAYENTSGGVNVAAAAFLAADNNAGAAAATGVGNLAGVDLVTLSGISDVTSLTTANLLFI